MGILGTTIGVVYEETEGLEMVCAGECQALTGTSMPPLLCTSRDGASWTHSDVKASFLSWKTFLRYLTSYGNNFHVLQSHEISSIPEISSLIFWRIAMRLSAECSLSWGIGIQILKTFPGLKKS